MKALSVCEYPLENGHLFQEKISPLFNIMKKASEENAIHVLKNK